MNHYFRQNPLNNFFFLIVVKTLKFNLFLIACAASIILLSSAYASKVEYINASLCNVSICTGMDDLDWDGSKQNCRGHYTLLPLAGNFDFYAEPANEIHLIGGCEWDDGFVGVCDTKKKNVSGKNCIVYSSKKGVNLTSFLWLTYAHWN